MAKPMKATLSEIKAITMIERRRCIRSVRQDAKFAKVAGREDAANALADAAVRLEHPEREDQ